MSDAMTFFERPPFHPYVDLSCWLIVFQPAKNMWSQPKYITQIEINEDVGVTLADVAYLAINLNSTHSPSHEWIDKLTFVVGRGHYDTDEDSEDYLTYGNDPMPQHFVHLNPIATIWLKENLKRCLDHLQSSA
jgi:hypothetical protein